MSTSIIFKEKALKKGLNQNELQNRMEKILPDIDSDIVRFLTNKLRMLFNEYTENENFVRSLIKGEAHREIDINKLINNLCGFDILLKPEEKNEIHNLIQQSLIDSLNELQMFEYVSNTFPLFSYLKRKLMELRPGTNKKQWEFILDKSNHLSKKLYEKFNSISHYREIDDDTCAKMIANIVKIMTNKRFDNMISMSNQHKGWYPNGLDELPVQTHDIKQKYLFLIAYSLKLDITKYIELQKRNEDLYDSLCYEDNMYRFALKFINIKDTSKNVYNYIEKIIKNNKSRFKANNNTTLFSETATNKIDAFLNDDDNKSKDIESLIESFIKLQENLGVSTAENREKLWNKERCKIASKSLNEIIDSMDVKKIKNYFKLYFKDNSTIKLTDLIEYKMIKECISQPDMIVDNLNENYFGISMSTEKTKERLLKLICDGDCDSDQLSYVPRTIRSILATKLTTNRINAIKENNENKSLTITRNDILRIGYLKTFIEFVNQEKKYKNGIEMMQDTHILIEKFETNTNNLLKQCHYSNLHITFPHDGLIYIALSSLGNDRCIPNVYQLCLPMKNLNQNID